jgi:hypothetical protein
MDAAAGSRSRAWFDADAPNQAAADSDWHQYQEQRRLAQKAQAAFEQANEPDPEPS